MDVIQFPKSHTGNRYAVVFMDYLTKWPEILATVDQSALTIAQLLVEHIISRHGVPTELLSDHGAAFLSRLMMEVCNVMGIKKTNTTAYHPQTDGLVERFNRTLADMLAKTVERSGKDWDTMFFLCIEPVHRNQHENLPFTSFMDVIHDSQEMLLCHLQCTE